MIGVFGGTFDPVHYGHLRTAHEVYRRFGLESLHVVPAAIPPHRRPAVASPAQRLRMVELAVPEFPGLVADDREIRRGGVSYTVPTLESLREEIGPAPLCFVLGADAFAGLTTWFRWQRLFDLAHLIVVQRPGNPLPLPDMLAPWVTERLCDGAAALAGRAAGALMFLTVTPRDISATRVRDQIARGQTPSPDELPPAVWEYIRRHNLYRSTAADGSGSTA